MSKISKNLKISKIISEVAADYHYDPVGDVYLLQPNVNSISRVLHIFQTIKFLCFKIQINI